ncbi:MAG: hypothetical protein WCO38_02460 [Verrucomicrobiota bacterium]|jgi:YHS domain-containing protein
MKIFKFLATLVLGLMFLSVLPSSKANESKTAESYPLNTCIVCGMKLSEMKPFSFVYKGQEVKVCDESEKTAFEANPEQYLKKIVAAKAKEKK